MVGHGIRQAEAGTCKVVESGERVSESTCIASEGTKASVAFPVGPGLSVALLGSVGEIGCEVGEGRQSEP